MLGPSSATPRQAPVCIALILLSCAGFLLIYLNAPPKVINWFSFTPFEIRARQVVFLTSEGEYWRLITPIFLHFSWLHIVFNSLWLWELGSRVERLLGSATTLLLVLAIAAISNAAQFWFTGPSLFGGMSGVVYGLLGFCWVAGALQPRWPVQPARPVLALMLGWLFLCLFGVVEMLGFGAIANAAHVGGLIAGAGFGAALGLLSRAGVVRPS